MSKNPDSEMIGLFAKLTLSNRKIVLSYAKELLKEQNELENIKDKTSNSEK